MSRKTGVIGEQLATQYLESLGYEILESNYYTQFGEIDIIADLQGILTFIEVKLRQSDRFGEPIEAITIQKIERVRKSAWIYLSEQFEDPPECKFFAVLIKLAEDGKVFSIKIPEIEMLF